MVRLTRFLTMAIALSAIVALLAVPAAARTALNRIEPGDTVFVYETNLNVSNLSPGGFLPTKFVKYNNDNPDMSVSGGGAELAEIPCDAPGVLSVQSEPAYLNGAWYAWSVDYNDPNTGHVNRNQYIYIRDPDIALDVVLGNSHIDSVNGHSVTRNTPISFKLTSNFVSSYYKVGSTHFGQVDVQILTPGGGTVAIFGSNAVDLRNLNLTNLLLYTDQIPNLSQISLSDVQPGLYTARAVWTEAMPWYNQEPNSNTVTFTVLSKPLTITANRETVVSGNDFTVSITGESHHDYYVYIRGGSSAGYPQMLNGQVEVNDTAAAQTTIENFVNDEAGVSGTLAIVTTDASGSRTVEFNTNDVTDDQKFTVKVIDPVDSSKYDSVDVQVKKGEVTLSMGGTGVFYMGEVINLAGTSSSGGNVYLFLTGPNLNSNGLKLDDATTHVVDGDATTFKVIAVDSDNSWSYKWDTSSLKTTLDPGTYMVYAIDYPAGKNSLSGHSYQTASVVIKKGFITVNALANTIASGDDLVIKGMASGKPADVYVWIFGKNYRSVFNSVSVQDDGTYSYKIDNIDLYDGQYYVVVQHPMANGPGVLGSDSSGDACSGTSCYGMIGSDSTYNLGLVRLTGLQASDAATSLQSALGSSYIDDLYAWATFSVASPFISLDPIPDHPIGQALDLHGTTNLASGDQILISVISLAFTPTTKGQSGGFNAAAGATTVYRGSKSLNEFNISFDTANFMPDQYSVTAEAVVNSATTSISFNMIIPTPTTTPTTPPTTVPTTPPTTIPTTVPTTIPTTEPTPESPGFDYVVAIVGLCAVAFLVLRKRD